MTIYRAYKIACDVMYRLFICGVCRRKRGVEMLFGEQRQRLLLHGWFGVELG